MNSALVKPISTLAELSDAVTAVANRAIKHGAEHTGTGTYLFDADDFRDLISPEDFVRYFDLIAAEIGSRDELLDLSADGVTHKLDCNFGLAYCPSYQWCDGDEIIFGSYEEWENAPTLHVSQPFSMHQMSQIGAETIDSVQKLMDKLVNLFGISIEELKQRCTFQNKLT